MRNIDRYECHPSVYQLFLVIYLYTSLSLSDSLFTSFSAFFFPLFLFLLQGKLIDDYRALQSWYANLLFFLSVRLAFSPLIALFDSTHPPQPPLLSPLTLSIPLLGDWGLISKLCAQTYSSIWSPLIKG